MNILDSNAQSLCSRLGDHCHRAGPELVGPNVDTDLALAC